MILADSTVRIDHLRWGDSLLASRLKAGQIWTHSFII
jgi:hypothetical protein